MCEWSNRVGLTVLGPSRGGWPGAGFHTMTLGPSFQIRVNSKEDGAFESAYAKFGGLPVDRTEELSPSVFVDLSADGLLVGIEFLAIVNAYDCLLLAGSLPDKARQRFKAFFDSSYALMVSDI